MHHHTAAAIYFLEHFAALLPLDCPHFDVTATAARLQLNTGIAVIPNITDHRRVIVVHCLLYGSNSVTVVLLGKGFTLEHEVFPGTAA